MSNHYAGKSGSFSAQIRAFADRAKDAIDMTMRDIIINIGNSVITINKISREYNQAVAEHNENLRQNPQNFDKRGYLKRGLKLNDGMGIRAPQGCVGGRFRGNWMFSVGSPDTSTVDQVDPRW